MSAGSEMVEAAGGVVVRQRGERPLEVAVIHRPRYDDWSLPKGKLDPGESFEDAALREVFEETGLACRLLRELEPVRYRDSRGRPKLVRYWLMESLGEDAPFVPNEEVDELRWLRPDVAAATLSHARDRELVQRL